MAVQQEQAKSKSSICSILIRVSVSAVLLLVIFLRMDVGSFLELLRNVDKTLLFYTFLFYLGTIFWAGFRWKVMIHPLVSDVRLWDTVSFYFVGFFFNNFLPTSVGGDVMRAWGVGAIYRKMKESFASALIERLLGLYATLFVAICAIPFAGINTNSIIITVLVMLFIVVLFMVFLFSNRAVRFLLKILYKIRFLRKASDTLESFVETVRVYRSRRKTVFYGFLISVVYQFLLILEVYLVSLSLGMNVPLIVYLSVVPIVWVISFIPVSLNGLGLRELGFSVTLTQLGYASENAVAVSLMVWFVGLCASVIGAVIFAVRKIKK